MSETNKLFLLIQSGYSAKNFILSGFLEESKKTVSIWSDQDFISSYELKNEFVKLPDYSYSSKVNFLQKIKNRAELYFNAKKFKDNAYLFYLIGIYKSTNLKSRLKNGVISIIARLFSSEKGIQYLDKPFYHQVRKTTYYKQCKLQLEKHQPTQVFCTHQRVSSGVAPMLAAKDLGIKTICFIHSWDNIPKGVLLIKADTYFVWSHYMKQEMISHYPFINPQNIKVTGTLQFINYFKKEYHLDKNDFFNQFNLDSSKKYILFTGNDKTTSPNDPIYLDDVCKAIQTLNRKEDKYRVLFRPNPIDENIGFKEIIHKNANILTTLHPKWFGTEDFRWNQGGPDKKDSMLLINTIMHCDVVVNMGSTMALDAALLNKASCYINYDVKSSYNWSVKRTYRFIHFKMIKKIAPVFWIDHRNEVKKILKEAIENPSITQKGRELWITSITAQPIVETNKRMWKQLNLTHEI